MSRSTRSTAAWVPFSLRMDRHTHRYYVCVPERQPAPGRFARPVQGEKDDHEHFRDRAHDFSLGLAIAMGKARPRLAGALVVMVHRHRDAHTGEYEYDNNDNEYALHVLPPRIKARPVCLPTRPMLSGTRRIENQRKPSASIAKIHRIGRTHIQMRRSMAYVRWGSLEETRLARFRYSTSDTAE
jgi:hypothetical protein